MKKHARLERASKATRFEPLPPRRCQILFAAVDNTYLWVPMTAQLQENMQSDSTTAQVTAGADEWTHFNTVVGYGVWKITRLMSQISRISNGKNGRLCALGKPPLRAMWL